MSSTVAPPGWHPDPSNPTGAFRWWDGTAWTAHTQPAPAPVTPAPVTPAPVTPAPVPPAPVAPAAYGSAATYGSAYTAPATTSPYAPTAPTSAAASPFAPAGPASAASPYAVGAGTPGQGYGNPYGGAPTAAGGTYYPAGFGRPANQSFARQNTHSLTAIGVAALYIAIAMASHVVLIGVIPIMLSIRAFNSRERLAPIALTAAIIAVIVAFAALR